MTTQKKTIAIEIHDMSVTYGKKPILWDIDLTCETGKFHIIVGPNGGGKSSLLKAIMNIIPKSSGYVKFFNKKLSQIRKRISYICQRQTIDWQFPASAYDIVMMGRQAHIPLGRRPTHKDKQIVQNSLQQVDMTPFAQQQIGSLSGGQQQRIFLARSLAQQADIYLLDEPLAGIDANTSTLILQLLKKLVQQQKTVIMIHHSLKDIEQYCDNVILLNMYVRAAGPPHKVLTPQLLQETYSSQLNILSNISHLLQQHQIPIRE